MNTCVYIYIIIITIVFSNLPDYAINSPCLLHNIISYKHIIFQIFSTEWIPAQYSNRKEWGKWALWVWVRRAKSEQSGRENQQLCYDSRDNMCLHPGLQTSRYAHTYTHIYIYEFTLDYTNKFTVEGNKEQRKRVYLELYFA